MGRGEVAGRVVGVCEAGSRGADGTGKARVASGGRVRGAVRKELVAQMASMKARGHRPARCDRKLAGSRGAQSACQRGAGSWSGSGGGGGGASCHYGKW